MGRSGPFAAILASIAVAIMGCAGVPAGGTGRPASSSPLSDRELQQAHDALERWDRALRGDGADPRFIPVGELTSQVGDWEAELGDNNKAALMAGLVEAAHPFDATGPSTAAVRWSDGTSVALPTLGAPDAVAAIRMAEGSCPDCRPITLTGARFATGRMETTRGEADVPVWEFAIEGSAVRVTRVAVAPSATVSVSPPPWNPDESPVGRSIESATGSSSSADLTVSFTGAPGHADVPCGEDYDGVGIESAHAVVVGIVVHRNPSSVACRLVGAPRTAIVHLATPLGGRAVLEILEGRPVPVSPKR